MSDSHTTESIREELTHRDNLSLTARITENPEPFLWWAVPMFVIRAQSGRTSSASRAISPGRFIAISKTP